MLFKRIYILSGLDILKSESFFMSPLPSSQLQLHTPSSTNGLWKPPSFTIWESSYSYKHILPRFLPDFYARHISCFSITVRSSTLAIRSTSGLFCINTDPSYLTICTVSLRPPNSDGGFLTAPHCILRVVHALVLQTLTGIRSTQYDFAQAFVAFITTNILASHTSFTPHCTEITKMSHL